MSQLTQVSSEYVGLLAAVNVLIGGGLWWFTRLTIKGLLEWKKEVSDELVETKVKIAEHERDIQHLTRDMERRNGKIPTNHTA